MSPILPLVLALTAIYLVFEGRNGRKEPASSSPQIENRAENNPSQSLNQTGAKFETHYHAQDLAREHELRFKAKITETLRLYLQDESAIKELTDALYSVIESNR